GLSLARLPVLLGPAGARAPPASPPVSRRTPSVTSLVARPRFVDRQAPPADFLPVQRAHGRIGLAGVGEFHESESLGAPGVAVRDQPGRFRLAERSEESAQLLLGGVVREVAYVEFHRDRPSSRPAKNVSGRPVRRSRTPSISRSDFGRSSPTKGERTRTRRVYHAGLLPQAGGRAVTWAAWESIGARRPCRLRRGAWSGPRRSRASRAGPCTCRGRRSG